MSGQLKIWHPFTQEALDPPPIRIVKAEGVYLYTDTGRRLIDGISSWWVNLHGHGHPVIVSAIAKQAAKVDHVLLAGFTHDAVQELSSRLQKYLPAGLERIFFSDDGSTAVEVALKLAVQYWQNLGAYEKRGIVALEHAYHGDTVGAMSVSDDSAFNSPFTSLRFPVYRLRSPQCRCGAASDHSSCMADSLGRFSRLLEEKHREIAAIIVEPLLQGAGGMIVHPPEFLKQLRRLCTEWSVLLIADEVLTGFGRTGKMFASEVAATTPDMMCLSKGLTGGVLPMGATVCTNAIYQAFVSDDPKRTFFHGHSYTGNPLAAAAGSASLRIFDSEPVFDRIQKIAEIHQTRLAAIRGHKGVEDVRSIGTVGVVELKAADAGYLSKLKPKLYRFFINAGILLRPLGNIIYVLPPYCISPEDLNYVYDQIAIALDLFAS